MSGMCELTNSSFRKEIIKFVLSSNCPLFWFDETYFRNNVTNEFTDFYRSHSRPEYTVLKLPLTSMSKQMFCVIFGFCNLCVTSAKQTERHSSSPVLNINTWWVDGCDDDNVSLIRSRHIQQKYWFFFGRLFAPKKTWDFEVLYSSSVC